MKKTIVVSMLLLAGINAVAGNDIVKTGYNVGPLPVVAYDADKGFQYGAIIQLFNYGDGHNYPNYDSKTYLEYSRFTKGSQLVQIRHDNKELIPGVRWSSALKLNLDKAYDFYGFNGYRSNYDQERIDLGKDENSGQPLFSPFYRYSRNELLLKSDFLGYICKNLQWEAGIFANYYKIGSIDYDSINKGKAEDKKFTETTLFDHYKTAGAISDEEADGGLVAGLRAGIVYDSRDKEGAPSKGIWAEAHITGALPGISETPYARFAATWRQYIPIIDHSILTFAYRLNYEGSLFGTAPFYTLSYITNMGEKCDFEGMGGYNTVRGIMRTRILGDDMALFNAELRWRFANFQVGKQNIALGLSGFSDGSMVTRARSLGTLDSLPSAAVPFLKQEKDSMHVTFGGGFRFIMNENFIVAVEYGTPLSHLMKKSPVYNQDGTGAFYINLGYLF